MERTHRTWWETAHRTDDEDEDEDAQGAPRRHRRGRAVRAAALTATVLAGTGLGCGAKETCSNRTSEGLIVTVTDGAGGPSVCDATVTVSDGAYSEILAATVPAAGCTYQGARERAGTYTIDVVWGGETAAVHDVTVTASQCTVVSRQVTIPLPR